MIMPNLHHEYRDAFLMGDLVLRVSLLVQRGFLCSKCGSEIDGQYHSALRRCRTCEELSSTAPREHGNQAVTQQESD